MKREGLGEGFGPPFFLGKESVMDHAMIVDKINQCLLAGKSIDEVTHKDVFGRDLMDPDESIPERVLPNDDLQWYEGERTTSLDISEYAGICLISREGFHGAALYRCNRYVADIPLILPETNPHRTSILFVEPSVSELMEFARDCAWTLAVEGWECQTEGHGIVCQKDNQIIVVSAGRLLGAGNVSVHHENLRAAACAAAESWIEDTDEENRKLFDQMIRFAKNQVKESEDQKSDLKREIESQAEYIKDYSKTLLEFHRKKREGERKLKLLDKAITMVTLEGFKDLFAHVSAIENFSFVDSVELSGSNIVVSYKPGRISMEQAYNYWHNETSGECTCCEYSDWQCSEALPDYGCIHFYDLTLTINTEEGRVYVRGEHPHVSGGMACFGNAQYAIDTCLAEEQYDSLVAIIAGWALKYNHESPYSNWDNFEFTSNAKPGWEV